MSSKKLSSTKVNVNYMKSSIDIFKFYQRVLNSNKSNNKAKRKKKFVSGPRAHSF